MCISQNRFNLNDTFGFLSTHFDRILYFRILLLIIANQNNKFELSVILHSGAADGNTNNLERPLFSTLGIFRIDICVE